MMESLLGHQMGARKEELPSDLESPFLWVWSSRLEAALFGGPPPQIGHQSRKNFVLRAEALRLLGAEALRLLGLALVGVAPRSFVCFLWVWEPDFGVGLWDGHQNQILDLFDSLLWPRLFALEPFGAEVGKSWILALFAAQVWSRLALELFGATLWNGHQNHILDLFASLILVLGSRLFALGPFCALNGHQNQNQILLWHCPSCL